MKTSPIRCMCSTPRATDTSKSYVCHTSGQPNCCKLEKMHSKMIFNCRFRNISFVNFSIKSQDLCLRNVSQSARYIERKWFSSFTNWMQINATKWPCHDQRYRRRLKCVRGKKSVQLKLESKIYFILSRSYVINNNNNTFDRENTLYSWISLVSSRLVLFFCLSICDSFLCKYADAEITEREKKMVKVVATHVSVVELLQYKQYLRL